MKLPITPNSFVPAAGVGRMSLQRGLSLIELMISITIGLLILAALSTLFVNQSRTRSELDKSNRMIDNGRYAMELLSDDLSLAGFYGEFNPSGLPAPSEVQTLQGLPNPCTTIPAKMMDALLLAVQGYDAASQSSTVASPPCGLGPKAGSDILVIRRASTVSTAADAAIANRHYLQVSGCMYDYDTGKFYVIDTNPASFTLRAAKCLKDVATPYAVVRDFMVEAYFVSPDNVPGDGIPTLKRSELNPTTHLFEVTPLVEGIEYMQIDYGLDTNDDGAPDSYVQAPAALGQWSDVVAVKVHILARNTEPTRGHKDTKTYDLGLAGTFGPFNDEFKRHAYTRFVTLVNPAGRRH